MELSTDRAETVHESWPRLEASSLALLGNTNGDGVGDQLAEDGGSLLLHLAVAVAVAVTVVMFSPSPSRSAGAVQVR